MGCLLVDVDVCRHLPPSTKCDKRGDNLHRSRRVIVGTDRLPLELHDGTLRLPNPMTLEPMTPATAVPGGVLDALSRELIPGVLVLLAMALYAPRLHIPPQYMFDEAYHAFTAAQYAAGNVDAYIWYTDANQPGVAYMWNHPPMGLLMITGGVLLWGDQPFGWRFASAIFGAVGVVLVYLLARAMLRDRAIAVTAAGLLLFETLWFVQARVAMLDIFGTVFALAALLSLYVYLTRPPDRIAAPLVSLGTSLGLALANKWNAAFLAAFAGLTLLARAFILLREHRAHRTAASWQAVRSHLVWVPVALGALPVAIYLVAYIPFFATGHDGSQFIELQRQIFVYHSRLKELHDYQSRWWEWPLALRPVWYAVTRTDGLIANTYANTNPVLAWLFVPAVIALSVQLWRSNRAALLVVAIGFFGQWLPWALSPRSSFAYHFLPAVPMGVIAVAFGVVTLFRRGGAWRFVVPAYVAAVVGFFVYFYPIHASVPLALDSFEARMWLGSWR